MLLVELDQALGSHLKAGGAAQHQAAFETCGRHANVPALPFFAEAIEGGDTNILKEDFSESRFTINLRDRLHAHTRRIQREEDERQALVALGAWVGAKQAKGPVSEHCARRPNLVAAQHVFVALAAGGGTNRSKIAASLWLGPGLCPDLFAGCHGGEEARLLVRRTELHQRRPEQEDAVLVDAQRSAGAPVLFLEDQPLDQVETTAAIFARPGDHAPTAFVELALPFAMSFKTLARRVEGRQRRGWDIRLHPRTHFHAKRIFFRTVCQIHGHVP